MADDFEYRLEGPPRVQERRAPRVPWRHARGRRLWCVPGRAPPELGRGRAAACGLQTEGCPQE